MAASTATGADKELCKTPRWRAEDLGRPLPESPHATSVAMPLWQHVVGYEEGDPAIVERLEGVYPRFAFHPIVRRLFAEAHARFAREGAQALVFPSERTARDCRRFLTNLGHDAVRVHPYNDAGLHAVVFPQAALEGAKSFWQHFGELVSSRRAEAALAGRSESNDGDAHRARLRERIAGFAQEPTEAVYLYPTGMAAMTAALRLVQHGRPGAKSIQLGFPYVDGLKIQTVRGPGAHFFPACTEDDLAQVTEILAREPISALFCELPTNPLLRSLDIPRLAEMARKAGVPLVVDDTISTFANVDVRPYADLLVSSLTKMVSGTGDVMGGSLILCSQSPHRAMFDEAQPTLHEDLLWGEDAAALEANSRDFLERAARINATSEAVCDYLYGHPAVARLYYSKYETPEAYAQVMRPGGGYSGLFSILLQDAAERAEPFYDALRISKGPSLGVNFSLACPYTLLAHYRELDWAESLGISRHLLRVSVGLEDAEDLIHRFDEAFRAAGCV